MLKYPARWGTKVMQHRGCINKLSDLGGWPNSPLQIHYAILASSGTLMRQRRTP
jgi:hypothetical protein